MLIFNDAGQSPVAMQGDPNSVSIPVVMISNSDGLSILAPADVITGKKKKGKTVSETNKTKVVRVVISVDQLKEDVLVKYNHWSFTTTRLWGEPAEGEWKLSVQDKYRGIASGDSQGAFESWRLIVWNDSKDNGMGDEEEVGSAEYIVIGLVIVVFVMVVAGGVVLLMMLKRKNMLPRWCSSKKQPSNGVLNISGTGLASEEDFDFENEPDADTLFLSSASEGEDKDRATRNDTIRALDDFL